MKVVSLFDGISGARVALDRLGIEPEAYLASEIDVYAIHCSRMNWPHNRQIGTVVGLKLEGTADLLIGGSPCQDLSGANTKAVGLYGKRSVLFFEFVRILDELKPKYWLFENVASMTVKMRKEITKHLGVKPILIDSALVSAQRRKRLYWTNIEGIEQPADRGIKLIDILEDHPEEIYYYSDRAIAYMDRRDRTGRTKWDYHYHSDSQEPKSVTVVANFVKGVPNNVLADHTNEVFRRFTPLEVERLQGYPDNYTSYFSNSRRWKMLGNAFQVDTIAHILSYVKEWK